MTIFIKPLNEITFDDVVTFCGDGQEESVNLDYKKDFPKDLEKSISAFANTSGGLIIIGVDEENNRPKTPFEGIDYFDKAEDRVWSIDVDNIYPPVEIGVKSIPNADKSKMFVLIRVPESHEAPHAIWNRTHIHIRTGNRTKPEELANFDQLEWLLNRRKRSEDFRESMLKNARERFHALCQSNKSNIPFGELTISYIPLYPQAPLMKLNDIIAVFESFKKRNKEGLAFPQINYHLIPVQNGIINYEDHEDPDGKIEVIQYYEFNQFGLLFYKNNLSRMIEDPSNQTIEIRIYGETILEYLDLSLEWIGLVYNSLGYTGLAKATIRLDKITGIKFHPLLKEGLRYPPTYFRINVIEPELKWEFEVSTGLLLDSNWRQTKLLTILKDACWSLGYQTPEEAIIEKMQALGRWK